MKIAINAMGSDYAPEEIVKGASFLLLIATLKALGVGLISPAKHPR